MPGVLLKLEEVANRFLTAQEAARSMAHGGGQTDNRDRQRDPKSRALSMELAITQFCEVFQAVDWDKHEEMYTRRGTVRVRVNR